MFARITITATLYRNERMVYGTDISICRCAVISNRIDIGTVDMNGGGDGAVVERTVTERSMTARSDTIGEQATEHGWTV